MILLLFLIFATIAVAVIMFLLGFRLGHHSQTTAVQNVRAQAAVAQRELHELTRAAFVAMAEQAERRRDGRK